MQLYMHSKFLAGPCGGAQSTNSEEIEIMKANLANREVEMHLLQMKINKVEKELESYEEIIRLNQPVKGMQDKMIALEVLKIC